MNDTLKSSGVWDEIRDTLTPTNIHTLQMHELFGYLDGYLDAANKYRQSYSRGDSLVGDDDFNRLETVDCWREYSTEVAKRMGWNWFETIDNYIQCHHTLPGYHALDFYEETFRKIRKTRYAANTSFIILLSRDELVALSIPNIAKNKDAYNHFSATVRRMWDKTTSKEWNKLEQIWITFPFLEVSASYVSPDDLIVEYTFQHEFAEKV